jgi:hypothetical protein
MAATDGLAVLAEDGDDPIPIATLCTMVRKVSLSAVSFTNGLRHLLAARHSKSQRITYSDYCQRQPVSTNDCFVAINVELSQGDRVRVPGYDSGN